MSRYEILNLGAGVQSSRLLLESCRGDLPKFDAAIFADTQWEPQAVYTHLEWLKDQAAAAGIPVLVRTAGDLRADGIAFRTSRQSADGKRFASIPVFVRNRDGSTGLVKRQCTSDYKIEVVERTIRQEILGLKPRQRVPKGVLVRQWFGISADESQRAAFPGRYAMKNVRYLGLFGDAMESEEVWRPVLWREHVYPFLCEARLPDRTIRGEDWYDRPQTRSDCVEWLVKHYPERTVPRSACIGCPFRSNDEWLDMKITRPDEWADACEFDEAMRAADTENTAMRKRMVGTLYLHRQLVPLRMADLGGAGEKGGGCGTLFDGMDGMCGV